MCVFRVLLYLSDKNIVLSFLQLVISSTDYTFGNTAAMRTARPVFHRVLERNDEGSLVNNACGLGRIASGVGR